MSRSLLFRGFGATVLSVGCFLSGATSTHAGQPYGPSNFSAPNTIPVQGFQGSAGGSCHANSPVQTNFFPPQPGNGFINPPAGNGFGNPQPVAPQGPPPSLNTIEVQYRMVTEYVPQTVSFRVPVVRYDHCGRPFQAEETRTRTVLVPVQRVVRTSY